MAEEGFTLERVQDNGTVRGLRLTGRLTLRDGADLWPRLLDEAGEAELTVDLGELEALEGGAAALLVEADLIARQRGGGLRFEGARPEVEKQLQLYGCPEGGACLKSRPQDPGMIEQLGIVAEDAWQTTKGVLAFAGDMSLAFVAAVRRPGSIHWRDLTKLMDKAGSDGLPIVLLINFLVGTILGLQSAYQLRQYGADLFVANLVGLSVTRELAPLMTAIIVAGRSGAAYAAELGSMRVSEEVDALRTMGQDPQRFLVFPRVVALALVVPLLTLLGDIVGCLGGLVVAITTLDLTVIRYVDQLERALDLWDVFGGIVKSVFFAVTITLIACQRGLATRGGAAGVGASTTSAVVVTLFALVLLDALFATVYNALGI